MTFCNFFVTEKVDLLYTIRASMFALSRWRQWDETSHVSFFVIEKETHYIPLVHMCMHQIGCDNRVKRPTLPTIGWNAGRSLFRHGKSWPSLLQSCICVCTMLVATEAYAVPQPSHLLWWVISIVKHFISLVLLCFLIVCGVIRMERQAFPFGTFLCRKGHQD